MKNLLGLFSVLLLAFTACTNEKVSPTKLSQPAKENIPTSFSTTIENAHAKNAFERHEAIKFDIKIIYGGNEILNGKISLSTDSRKGIIEFVDGRKIIYSDGDIYYSPTFDNAKSPRFTAYTWSYFFLFPYKLNDPGTIWSDYKTNKLNSKIYDVRKMTFEPGTGDAPEDWYIVYADKSSKRVQVAAYIVTAGRSREKAEEDPHAIQYLNYLEIEGVPIAQKWKFWEWRTDGGLTKQLGEASLSNCEFIDVSKELFEPTKDMSKG